MLTGGLVGILLLCLQRMTARVEVSSSHKEGSILLAMATMENGVKVDLKKPMMVSLHTTQPRTRKKQR